MSFEWDESKRNINIDRHGIDFEFAKLVFDGPIIEAADMRRDYGARRFVVYGAVDGFEMVVVYTIRGGNRRLIPARRASHEEREEYWRRIGARPSG